MGTFKVEMEIGDETATRFERIEALVDTGATYTLMPASVLGRLGVMPVRRDVFELADGRLVEKDVGQTWIRVDGRPLIALVIFGDETVDPRLGANTLEGLLLAPDPVRQRLVPVSGLLM